jgi:hypothetical protein
MTTEEFVNRPRPAPPHVTSTRGIGEVVGDALEVGMVTVDSGRVSNVAAPLGRREAVRIRPPWRRGRARPLLDTRYLSVVRVADSG